MRTILALLIGFLAAAGHARAADDLSWIIELLDSPEWEVREAFTDRLQHDHAITLKQIEALVRDEGVSAEARLRLARVAKIRFFQSSRAAVGMGPVDASIRYGVTVRRLQEGFDAKRVLRVGDKLIQAQGRPVRDWDRFRALILSNDPGDSFEVVVVRDGETIPLTFTLGRYANLDNPNPIIDPSLLEEAWQIRMSDTLNDDFGQAADTGFPLEPRWRQDKLMAQANWPDNGTRRTRTARASTGTPTTEAAGHQAVFDWGRLERIRGGTIDDSTVVDEQVVEIYRRHLKVQEERIETLRRRLEDPTLDEQTRHTLVARIERMTPAVNYLKRWIAETDAAGPGG